MTDTPIFSPDNETALITSVLRHPEQLPALLDIVPSSEYFWFVPYQWCWKAFISLHEQGLEIDIITLGDELKRSGNLDEFHVWGAPSTRGRDGLAMLKDTATRQTTAASYALEVQDYYVKRLLDQLAPKISSWARNGRRAAAIIHDVETEFSKVVLHTGNVVSHTFPIDIAASRAMDVTDRASKGEEMGVDTGFAALDEILYPQNGELVIIAARPGQGKSAMLGTIALRLARHNKRILYFTLENSGTILAHRLISQISHIDSEKIIKGRMTENEWPVYYDACDQLANLKNNLVLCDLRGIRINQVRAEARKYEGLSAIIFDYIQLAAPDEQKKTRELEVAAVTQGLFNLAGELNIPLFAAAQMSRAQDQRSDKRPVLSDLRESGSLENTADSIAFLYYPEEDIPKDPYRYCEVIVAKHRNGKTGNCILKLHKPTATFLSDEEYVTSTAIEVRKPYAD